MNKAISAMAGMQEPPVRAAICRERIGIVVSDLLNEGFTPDAIIEALASVAVEAFEIPSNRTGACHSLTSG